jgi:hypothetical protein
VAARGLGAAALKTFPAGQVGGPAYLKALCGPFPYEPFVPVGGVDEAQDLWGSDLETTCVRRLLPRPRILVVKDGARSATAFGEEDVCTVPALPTKVVEPVGAGDAFAAGSLAGLLNGGDLRRAR